MLRRLLTISFCIKTLKRPRLQSHCHSPCPPRPPRLLYHYNLSEINALFVSLKTTFHRSTATDIIRESTRFNVTCFKFILIRHHATATVFKAFISLTPIPPQSRNQSSVWFLPVKGWSCKVKIISK